MNKRPWKIKKKKRCSDQPNHLEICRCCLNSYIRTFCSFFFYLPFDNTRTKRGRLDFSPPPQSTATTVVVSVISSWRDKRHAADLHQCCLAKSTWATLQAGYKSRPEPLINAAAAVSVAVEAVGAYLHKLFLGVPIRFWTNFVKCLCFFFGFVFLLFL